MKSLVAQGIRTTKRQANPILLEQEDILWEKEVFCSRFAKSIQNTVFFYAYKVFGLRECDEHRKLMCRQFILNSDDRGVFIQFVGRQRKTYQGGLRQMQLSNKNIKHYCASGKFLSINPLKSLYCIFVCISNPENFFRGGGYIYFHTPPQISRFAHGLCKFYGFSLIFFSIYNI